MVQRCSLFLEAWQEFANAQATLRLSAVKRKVYLIACPLTA